MIATFCGVVIVVAVSVLAGQFLCWISGARTWADEAPAVGLSWMLVSGLACLHLPGRMTTAFVLTALPAVAGAWLMVTRPGLRPPGLLAPASVAVLALTLVPFLVHQRFGILGFSFNNDMSAHLLYAWSYRDPVVAHAAPILDYYPFGPHAASAALNAALSVPMDAAFTGFTLAAPVLTAMIAVQVLEGAPRGLRVVAAVLAGLPYIAAAYLGQGAFKELMLTTLLLGVTAWLIALRAGGRSGPLMLLPGGLIACGILSCYAIPGLVWPFVLLLGVGMAALVSSWSERGLAGTVRAIRVPWTAIALATAAGAVLMVPQAPRMQAFWDYMQSAGTGTGIAKDQLGNLSGPIELLSAGAIWFAEDFRLAPVPPMPSAWLALGVFALALFGAVRLGRERRPELVAGAVACAVLWWYADRTQSPYTAAKGLVPLSTFLVLLAAAWIAPRAGEIRSMVRARLAVGAVAAGLMLWSLLLPLTASPVGANGDFEALDRFRDSVEGQVVAYPANEEFGTLKLRGAAVVQPTFQTAAPWAVQGVVRRGVKVDTSTGGTFDLDVFPDEILNAVQWAVVPINSASSRIPPGFELSERSGRWALYRRTGTVPQRRILPGEDGEAGAVLRCSSPSGRALLAAGGRAWIRPRPLRVAVPPVPGGTRVELPLELPDGRYAVSMGYQSRGSVEVEVGDMSARAPADLNRVGAAFDLGRTDVRDGGTKLTVTPEDLPLNRSKSLLTAWVTFTPLTPQRNVEVRRACGRYVDWVQPGAPTTG